MQLRNGQVNTFGGNIYFAGDGTCVNICSSSQDHQVVGRVRPSWGRPHPLQEGGGPRGAVYPRAPQKQPHPKSKARLHYQTCQLTLSVKWAFYKMAVLHGCELHAEWSQLCIYMKQTDYELYANAVKFDSINILSNEITLVKKWTSRRSNKQAAWTFLLIFRENSL